MTDSSDTPDRPDRAGRAGPHDEESGPAGTPGTTETPATAETPPDTAPPNTDTDTDTDTTDNGTTDTGVPDTGASGTGTADTGAPDTGAPPRTLLVAAAVLAVALAAGVGAIGVFGGDAGPGTGSQAGSSSSTNPTGPAGPLPLVSIPAPESGSDACHRMLEAVPGQLTSSGEPLEQRELAEPAPPATAAWGRDNPVVLRCGLDRPSELTRTSSLRQINGVQWLHVPDETGPSATWYVVDRPVHLALTVPEGTGTGPLQRISDLAGETLEQVPPAF
ncbi:hypothetical protein GCM10009676_27220 [Prauserella halophila]|uniref:DUF3515 domain-containing protein n=2 Tax=Prauserella halophila TaxID=185641 RepID=A0ABN1W9M7_9PSEU|nr:Protein of unknown function (DUF3515) [Prauserella halophila]